MRKKNERPGPVDKMLNPLGNTLPIVYSHLYFPCYSNSLKDIGRCLGFSWSDEQASGIQSIAWTMKWEITHDEEWKQKLTTYNLEDCLALRRITEFVQAACAWTHSGASKPLSVADGPQVSTVNEIEKLSDIRKWGME